VIMIIDIQFDYSRGNGCAV